MELKPIEDANKKIAGFTLDHLKFYLEPIEKGQIVNLDPKSQVCLTVDGKNTDIAIQDIFVEITSMQGNIIKGWSMLQIIEEDQTTLTINHEKIKIGIYDKITGVHCKIVDLGYEIMRKDDKEITTEDLAKYWNILQTGKVTAKNEVKDDAPTVEQKLAEALKKYEELEKKIADEKKAAEDKIIAEQKEKEEKQLAEAKAKEEEELAKAKAKEQDELAKAKAKKDKEEAEAKEREEEEKKAALAEQKRKETVAKQLGGQSYLDFQEKRKKEGYHEYSNKALRFFFKDEDEAVYLIKLKIGEYIDMEDALDTYREGEDGEYIFDLNEDGEVKDLIFDPKAGTIEIKKQKAKVE